MITAYVWTASVFYVAGGRFKRDEAEVAGGKDPFIPEVDAKIVNSPVVAAAAEERIGEDVPAIFISSTSAPAPTTTPSSTSTIRIENVVPLGSSGSGGSGTNSRPGQLVVAPVKSLLGKISVQAVYYRFDLVLCLSHQ